MEQLQQVEWTEPRIASVSKWRRDPKFNVHAPDFDFHNPEYLAYIEHAPRAVKEEALDAALEVARAQIAAGDYIDATPEQLGEGLRLGLSFEEMKQWLGQQDVHA